MKKVQRILMALAICSLSVVVVACSSKDDKKKTTTTENKDNSKKEENKKEEEKGTKVDSAGFLQKYTEAIKTVKSSKAVVEKKQTINGDNGTFVSTVTMDMSMSDNPTIIKIYRTSLSSENKKTDNEQYITDIVIYSQHYQTKEWSKATFEAIRKLSDGRRDLVNYKNALEFVTSVKDNLTVVQKSSTYEVTYSGNDSSFGDVISKVLIYIDRSTEKLLKQVKSSGFEFKFIVDAKTFLPTEFYIKANYDYYENGQKVDGLGMVEEISAKYSDVNNVEAITIPENVLNAKNADPNLPEAPSVPK